MDWHIRQDHFFGRAAAGVVQVHCRPGGPGRTDFWALLALGSVFTIIPLLQIHALRHLKPFTVNVTYNLEPLYSILFAAIIFGETREVGPSFWTGLVLIVISVVLQSRRQLA